MSWNEVYRTESNESYIVFVGLLLSCGISLFLSVSLFASTGVGFGYKLTYGGIAIALELAKLSLIPELVKHYKAKQRGALLLTGGLFFALSLVSVMGSVGSIQSDSSSYSSAVEKYESQLDNEEELKAAYLEEIEQNNQAIEYYQANQLIQLKAAPLKARNSELREDVSKVQARINEMVKPKEDTITVLAGTVSKIIGSDKDSTQTGIVILFSLLLEICAGYFVFKATEKKVTLNVTPTPDEDPRPRVGKDVETFEDEDEFICERPAKDDNVYAFQPVAKDEVFEKLKADIASGYTPSKRNVMAKYGVGAEKVKNYFDALQDEGIVTKGGNGRYMVVG